MAGRKSKDIWEYGDFQTPPELAINVAMLVNATSPKPRSILEPTCGRGAFLRAAGDAFPDATRLVGLEINSRHLEECKIAIKGQAWEGNAEILHADFFATDWDSILNDLPEPILIIGNPPWVTSAELGLLGSLNIPEKSNFQQWRGIDALTGKSNFDISEWMLLKQIEWLQARTGIIAMLCKSSVARKILVHSWKHGQRISDARIYGIDAKKHFGAAVDACLLVVNCAEERVANDCAVYSGMSSRMPSYVLGYCHDTLISDVATYQRWMHLRGADLNYVWRSGIKHDCSSVMELTVKGDRLYNGLHEEVDLEDDYVFPLFKSSDIGNGIVRPCRKRIIVTQRTVGADTAPIAHVAPKTMRYLQDKQPILDKRASSIYRNRPAFSIFGVGDYSFAPWKVAISGFYKNLNFNAIGPVDGRPPMFDDTVYFLPCASEDEALFLSDLLNSKRAREFFESMIFWAEKRPITGDLLRRLNLSALATEVGRRDEYETFVRDRAPSNNLSERQRELFVARGI